MYNGDKLESSYGLSHDFVQALLNFTNGDLEAAERMVESSEKDILAIKAKFILSKKPLNGAMIIFYNFLNNMPEYILSVVTSDNKAAKLRLENPLSQVYDEILRLISGRESDLELTTRIEKQILNPDQFPYITKYFSDRHDVDYTNLKRYIVNEIGKSLIDNGVVVKVVPEEIETIRYRQLFQSSKLGLKLLVKDLPNITVLLMLRVEPILAPLGGKDIEKLVPGDEVLVNVLDNRDIALFALKYFDSTQTGPGKIYGKVVQTARSNETENITALLEFAPGIFGRFVIGRNIRVQARDNTSTVQARDTQSALVKDYITSGADDNLSADYIERPYNEIGDGTEKGDQYKKNNNVLIFIMIAGGVVIVLLLILVYFIV